MVKRVIFISIFIFLFLYSIYSKTPTINVSINSNQVGTNENFQITIEIQGETNASLDTNFNNFDPHINLNYSGRSSSYVMDFSGTTTASTTYTLTGMITKEGEYEIGPFTIIASGKKYKSESVKIKVDKSNVNQQTTNTTSSNNLHINSNTTNNMYLIYLNTSKTTVYQNEYFDISVDFYVADDFQFKNYKAIKLPDSAWVDSLEDKNKKANKVVLNNRYYYHYQIEKKRVYISKAGDYDIKPATINFDGYDPNSFYFSAKPYSIKTKVKHIKVLPLPKNNTGIATDIVGHFELRAKLTPSKITTGDSSTLKIELSGEGNFQNIDNLSYAVDSGLESYTPKSDITTKDKLHKTKKWEILLIPDKIGNYSVTVDDVCYFDIFKKKFVVLRGKNFRLIVKKGVNKNKDRSITVLNKDNETSETNNYDSINYIKLSKGSKVYNSYIHSLIIVIIFYSSLILGVLILILIKLVYYLRYKNSSILTRNTAFKKFQKTLKIFERRIRQKNPNITEIINGLSKSIEQYFIDKFSMDSIEFTATNIESILDNFVEHKYLKKIKEIMIKLDMIRFGGIDTNSANLIDLINEINQVIKKIDSSNINDLQDRV